MSGRSHLQLQINHRLMEELVAKEKRYRSMLEMLRNPVVLLEPNCRIAFLNNAWTESLGHTVKDCLGVEINEYVSPSNRSTLSPAFMGSISDTSAFEIRFLHQDGREIWFEATFSRDLNGRLTGMLYNIDERRQTARLQWAHSEKLSLLNQELLEVSRQKDSFLASISHELRTPLNSVLGYTQLLQGGIYGEISEQGEQAVANISEAGTILLRTVDAILEYTGLELMNGTTGAEPVEIEELTEQACEMLRPEAVAKQIRLETSIFTGARLRIEPRHWHRIVTHLLVNAIRFTPAAGRVSVEVEPDAARRNLSLKVSDTGPGIPPNMIDQIFEPLKQHGDAYTRLQGGVGLGLAIVKRLVGLYGGDIEVANAEGGGALFHVRMPMNKPLRGEESAEDSPTDSTI